MLAIGSILFWTTAINSEVKFFLKEKTGRWESKAGVILKADSTGIQQRGQQVWKYSHSFALNGNRYLGASYSRGKKFDAGQIAFVQYDPVNPTINYLVGLQRSAYPWQVNLFLIVPLLGIIFILGAYWENRRFLHLLKTGEFARGKLTEKLATGQSVKAGLYAQPVFKYLFSFEYEGAAYIASCQTHRTAEVEDEEAESILFDKWNPYYNLVYDAMPNAPVINAAGKMEPVPKGKSGVLFLPVFTLTLNLLFLVFG